MVYIFSQLHRPAAKRSKRKETEGQSKATDRKTSNTEEMPEEYVFGVPLVFNFSDSFIGRVSSVHVPERLRVKIGMIVTTSRGTELVRISRP